MYLALNTGNLGLQISFEEAVRLAAKHGFGAIECDPLAVVEQHGVGGAQDLCARHGVVPVSFGLPVPVQVDAEGYERALAQLPRHAQAARALGIHRCSTYIFSWSDDLPFEANFDAHVRRIRPCAQVLEDHGIALGLEFLGPRTLYSGKPHAFIHTLEGMLSLCDAIGTGNMGILLDAYHAYSAGMDVADCLGAFRDETQIAVVHINDARKGQPLDTLPDTLRYLPGEGGGIDLRGFLASLKAFGYTGPVIVEPFSESLKRIDDPDEVIRVVAESVRPVWPR